jgi:hypothetical protein
VHGGKSFPIFAAILGAENVASLLALKAPRRNIDSLAVLRIEANVVQDVIVASAQMGKAIPTVAAVLRNEEYAGAGAKENVVRIAGIRGQTADVTTFRPQRRPLRGGQNGRQE